MARSPFGPSTRSASMRTMRFSRLWAIDAFDALAPKRSTRFWRRADLLGLGGGHLGQADLVAGPGRLILAVGAPVLGDGAGALLAGALEVHDAGDGLVEQVEVVAHDEQRTAVAAQELHEPRLGVGVEVVRRLVEEEHVATGVEDAGQLHPAALAARQHAEGQVQAIGAQPQAGGDAADLGLGGVAAVVAELVFGLGEAGDVGVARVLLHLDPQLLDAGHGLVEAAARQDVLDGGAAVQHAGDAGVLGQVPEPADAGDRAGHRGGRPAQDPQQARLAGPVAADEADLVPGAHGEGGVGHNQTPTDLHAETAGHEHDVPGWQRRRAMTTAIACTAWS